MEMAGDLAFAEQRFDAATRLVVADHTKHGCLRTERRHVAGHVGRTAKTFILALDLHNGHRCFR